MSRDRITDLLTEAASQPEADRCALDRLVPLVYDELKRIARSQLAGHRRRLTLDTSALVHEAYFKLVDSERAPLASRAFFFGAAARAMRQVVVDAARRRSSLKRGAGVPPVTLEDDAVGIDSMADELLALDDGLSRLARDHPRPARVLECRYFGGLNVREIASALEVAPRTVSRDLTLAQAWLRRELGDGSRAKRVPTQQAR